MRALYTILIVAVLVYLLVAALLYLFQDRMVFLSNLPGRSLDATPADAGMGYEDVRVTTADGLRLHGWWVPAERARGALLFLHGNAGNISHRLDSLSIFHRLGLDVLIFDYRGYGQSEGRPGERGIYEDARAAWRHLVDERGVRPGNIVVFGRSLGGAVAARLAAEQDPAAVILESCFSSALDMARRLYPFLPARLITRLEFPVVRDVERLDSPVLVVHSRDDEIIPYSMGRALFSAAPEPKAFLDIRGDHNLGFLLSREDYVAGLERFLASHL